MFTAILRPASRHICCVLLGLVFMGLLSGCLQVQPYVDPAMRTVEYEALKRPAKPRPVVLAASFQVNGAAKPAVDEQVRTAVEKTFADSGIYAPVQDGDSKTEQITIVVNDLGNVGGAVASGVGTGLTMGLAGSQVADNYVMTVEYHRPGMPVIKKEYKHAIVTTVGVHSAPENLTPMPDIASAFARVVEDMTLRMLSDLQQTEGK